MEAFYGIVVGVVVAVLYFLTHKKEFISDKSEVIKRQSESKTALSGRVRDVLNSIDKFRAARKKLGSDSDSDS